MQLLDFVPDFSSWNEAASWIKKGQSISFTKCENIASLEWKECQEKGKVPFGLYSSKVWRKFALAIFLADLVSYPTPSDQVNFDRLLFLMHAFPEGFRVWWIEQEGIWWPVGYSGWYPMLETTFKLFEKESEKIKNRMVVPNLSTDQQKPLYLFNFSVIPSLKKKHSFAAVNEKICRRYQRSKRLRTDLHHRFSRRSARRSPFWDVAHRPCGWRRRLVL